MPQVSKRWPGTRKHFHTYEWRRTTSGVGKFAGGIWKCADPTCSHFMPAYLVDDILPGKSSFCTCGAPITLTIRNMKDAIKNAQIDEETELLTGRPMCEKCSGQRVEYPLADTIEYVEDHSDPTYRIRNYKPPIQSEELTNEWCADCQMSHAKGQHIS